MTELTLLDRVRADLPAMTSLETRIMQPYSLVQIHVTDCTELWGLRVAGLVEELRLAGYSARLRHTYRPWVILVEDWRDPATIPLEEVLNVRGQRSGEYVSLPFAAGR